MTDSRRLRRLTNKEIHQIAEDEIPMALERLMGGDHDARAIALAELTTFARAIIACMATTPAPGDPALEIGELHPASRIIALYSNPGQIEPGPFSEHDLRQQWNAQADELNQWESLDSSEQLAWAQTRAIAADRFLPPVAKPTPVDLAALHDPNFSGGLTPDQHLEVLWGGPDPRVAATPAPEEPDVERVLRLAAIIREVDGKHDLGAVSLAEAILAHPGFSGCHNSPADLPAPDHVNLIGFAFGREPWATWLRQGGCLESAHCELSDLMLAVLAKWGRPAALPAQGEVGELVAVLEADAECAEVEHYDLCNMTAAQMRRIAAILKGIPALQEAQHSAPLPQGKEGEV